MNGISASGAAAAPVTEMPPAVGAFGGVRNRNGTEAPPSPMLCAAAVLNDTGAKGGNGSVGLKAPIFQLRQLMKPAVAAIPGSQYQDEYNGLPNRFRGPANTFARAETCAASSAPVPSGPSAAGSKVQASKLSTLPSARPSRPSHRARIALPTPTRS